MKENKSRQYLILVGIEVGLFLVIALIIFILQSQGRVHTRGPLVFRENPTVTYIVGSAEVKRNTDSWNGLHIGDSLRADDLLRTGRESRLDVRFSDGTAVRLEAHTTIQLADLRIDTMDILVQKGTVFARFRRQFLDQQHKIRSSNAVAGIRGTSLVVEATEQNTIVSVLSGVVEVYNPQHPETVVPVYTGMNTTIPADSPPHTPQSIPPDRARGMEHLLRNIQFEQVLLVSSTIQFEPNTSRIIDKSINELAWVLSELREHDYSVRIDGHTADVGTQKAMRQLSRARAERIRRYLVENDIEASRLQTRGFGATRPLTDNHTPEGRAQNRRVEFIITD